MVEIHINVRVDVSLSGSTSEQGLTDDPDVRSKLNLQIADPSFAVDNRDELQDRKQKGILRRRLR
jgi:hypothetical protein